MEKRFIAIKNKSGPVQVGTAAEYITMSDGTFLSDNLGDIDVMHKGSVADRLDKLMSQQDYAPINNPQFLNGISVKANANDSGYNISFGVAQTNNGWQTKVDNEIFINGKAVIKNEEINKGIIITPPAQLTDENILVADNGLQVKVGTDSVLNINNNNLEVLKDITLGANNITTTGNIVASNIVEVKSIERRTQIQDLLDNLENNVVKIFFLRMPGNLTFYLTGKTTSSVNSAANSAFGFCRLSSIFDSNEFRYFYVLEKKLYVTIIRKNDQNYPTYTDDLLSNNRIVKGTDLFALQNLPTP